MAVPRALDRSTSPIVETTDNSQAGPSRLLASKKRLASISLSDAETLAASSDTATNKMRTNLRALDTRKRKTKKRRRKQSVTSSIMLGKSVVKFVKQASGYPSEISKDPFPKESVEVNELSAQDAIAEPANNHELMELREKVVKQEMLIKLHKQFLSALAPSLTCQICLDPMRRPWTLSPCGHTACYRCLIAWFRAPPQHIPQPPPEHLVSNFDRGDPTLLARGMPLLLKKDKTCPHCRAIVREAPVEAWGIKDIVSHLFTTSQGSLATLVFPDHVKEAMTADETTGSIEAVAATFSTDAEPASTEAWQGIFKPLHQTRRGHVHTGDGHDIEHGGDRGFFDEEDGVYRCTTCYHEIWDGICSSCGRLYPGLLGHEGDEDDDNHHWMDAHAFDEGAWLDEPDVFGELHGRLNIPGIVGVLARGARFLGRDQNADRPVPGEEGARGQHRGEPDGARAEPVHHTDVDEDYLDHIADSGGEDAYESSFIDDEEHEEPEPDDVEEEVEEEEPRFEQYHSAEDEDDDGTELRPRYPSRNSPRVIEIGRSDSPPPRIAFVGGSSLRIISSPSPEPRRLRSRPRSRSPRPPGALDLSSDGGSEFDYAAGSIIHYATRERTRRVQIRSDNNEDDEEEDEEEDEEDGYPQEVMYQVETIEDPELGDEIRSDPGEADEEVEYERSHGRHELRSGFRYDFNDYLDRDMQYFSDDGGEFIGSDPMPEDDGPDFYSDSGPSNYGDAYSDDDP